MCIYIYISIYAYDHSDIDNDYRGRSASSDILEDPSQYMSAKLAFPKASIISSCSNDKTSTLVAGYSFGEIKY